MKINFLLLNLIFISLFIMDGIYAQSEELISIPWQQEKTIVRGDVSLTIPYIKNQDYELNIPNFFWRKKMEDNSEFDLSIELVSTELATKKEITYLKSQNIEVNQLKYDLGISKSSIERHATLNLFPFVMEGNSIHRILSFKVVFNRLNSVSPIISKGFASNSVLKIGSGTWYKISVKEDGIYKIDKTFLEECGVDFSVVTPQDIHIFGNGEGRLPELNSVPRIDDLAENAIQIVGESDGVFDEGDYILFYGWGAHRWYNTLNGFNQDRNPYSDESFYYININPSLAPKRIQNLASTALPITNTSTSYSYYDVHELDLKSLVKGGQRWYGELFDVQLTRSFLFDVPDVISSPASFEISYASNSVSFAGTSVTFSVNGLVLGSTPLPTASSGNFGRMVYNLTHPTPSSSMNLSMQVVRNSPEALTYLDRIQLNARRATKLVGSQFNFADIETVGAGNVTEFIVQNIPNSGFVWEVTNRQNPENIAGVFLAGDFIYRLKTDSLRKWVASDGLTFLIPNKIGEVEHQNLHGLDQADYLIVTNKLFVVQAERLADLHRAKGTTVHVVTTEQVFNEFSSGAKDATAIKMFTKMFYDRGQIDPTTRPKSLLLFGDGTFDPKNRVSNNNNFVLTYQLLNSEDHIGALVTDDYFGLLDDSESISSIDDVDIGIGRLLISNNQMAVQQVNKIEHYMNNGSNLFPNNAASCSSGNSNSTFGDWRLKYVQIADDEEGGYFLDHDVEPQYDSVTKNYPAMNCEKLYLDAFQQVSSAGGERYPDINEGINKNIANGCLVMNYVGHGGEVGVAEERVITVPQIQDWDNSKNLPLIVTATCEFTKYDDPDRVSAGEWASINPNGGAIALMTTTRSVYFNVNTFTGRSFYENVFKRDSNFQPRTFGEIIRQSKNGAGTSSNKRSFTLIGDPALQIALPKMNIVTDSINGLSPDLITDTLKALSKVTIKGHLEDFGSSVLTSFNGFVYPTIFDKVKIQQTLGNNATSPIRNFETQTNKLYRGRATVKNGYFEFTFIVPKDINYSYGFGKLSYYAEDGITDALGSEKRVYVGGIDPNGINDVKGPEVDLYLNDEGFVNGGITDENPLLIAQIFDENGINTVGNGIGHDLIAVLDGETGSPFVLNDYYIADVDSYQSGKIRYDFSNLEPGRHVLSLKVWDVNNNSSERSVEFIVHESEGLSLEHVLNYPNPFTTSTEFYFEHNQVCSQLQAQIQIMTVSGRLVKTINQYVNTEGFRSEAILWDGLDEFGDQLAKGVYIYRIVVTAPDGRKDEKLEKLVILK